MRSALWFLLFIKAVALVRRTKREGVALSTFCPLQLPKPKSLTNCTITKVRAVAPDNASSCAARKRKSALSASANLGRLNLAAVVIGGAEKSAEPAEEAPPKL
jgi:hypothetical protein